MQVKDKLRCPQCGGIAQSDIKHCTACGVKLVTVPTADSADFFAQVPIKSAAHAVTRHLEDDDDDDETDGDDDDEEDEVDIGTSRKSRKKKSAGKSTRNSKSFPTGILLIGILVSAVASFGLLVALPAVTDKPSDLDGTWSYSVRIPETGSTINGTMTWTQTGPFLKGTGVDQTTGGQQSFKIEGSVDGQSLTFRKLLTKGQYEYQGTWQQRGTQITAAGTWRQGIRIGGTFRPTRTDVWQATRLQAGEEPTTNPVEFFRRLSTDQSTPDRFKLALLAFVALGVGVTIISYRTFGPNG